MICILNQLSVFGEWTLRWDRLNSFWGTLAIVVLFILLVWGIGLLYAAVKREVSKRQWRFLFVCRLLAVLTFFLYCMQPAIVQWRDQSRVIVLCDTSRSMGIAENDSPADDARPKTRLERIGEFIRRNTHSVESLHPIVHELQCDSIGETHTTGCSIRPGKDWAASLIAWLDRLQATGKESRLAEQLLEVLQREKTRSLAGIILMSDGCNNIGMGRDTLLERLKTSPCPVHVVAVGEQVPQFEHGVIDVRAPLRNRLHSEIPVSLELVSRGTRTGKGQGGVCHLDLFMIGREAFDRDFDTGSPTVELKTNPVCSLQFFMTDSGELVAMDSARQTASAVNTPDKKQTITPGQSSLEIQTRVKATACGRFVLVAKLRDPQERVIRDGKPYAAIEVFDKKDKILLVAGGPLRDFQFFESRLKRSDDISTDVYLPFAKRYYRLGDSSGQDGQGQKFDSERFTSRFLGDYDVIFAFDPDWKGSFASSELDALEEWVAYHGGGLIVSAGPVFAGEHIDGWIQSERTKVVRSLYPVRFFGDGARIASDFSTALPRRIRFRAKDGQETGPFANIGHDGLFDWSAFPGFYGALPVESVKPAAMLWASLEETSQDGDSGNRLAVLFASQRYGAGRVFYIGNSELWRLRMLDESAPDRLLSNLIQYVSEGRREKMSPYGRLSVDREICSPGTTVGIQAVLYDVNAQPVVLENAAVETISPQGKKTELQLPPQKDMPGVFEGHMVATACGRWKLECPVPGTNEILRTSFLVKEDDLESPPSYRDEELLRGIAMATGGRYMSAESNAVSDDLASLLASIPAFERVAFEDRTVQYILRAVLLSILCSFFLIEWLSRRMMGLV